MNPLLSALLWPIVNGIGLLATALPRSFELKLGVALGAFYYLVDSKRRRIGEENMRRCLPELSEQERARLLKENYAHYGILFLELAHMFSPVSGHYRRYAKKIGTLEGFENWKRASDRGKGVLFISIHMANWEIMAAQGALHGMPITMATRRLKPEWFHNRLEAARLSAGFRCAYLPNTLPALLRSLRNGESCGFVMDQYAPPPTGIPATFFGAKVHTLGAAGTFVQRYGAAIVPVTQHRDAAGIVHVHIEPEMDVAAVANDPAKITQLLVSKVEAWIRANPAQWLWIHRRFKNAVWPTNN